MFSRKLRLLVSAVLVTFGVQGADVQQAGQHRHPFNLNLEKSKQGLEELKNHSKNLTFKFDATPLPAFVDLRTHDTPIQNQLDLGDCTCFAGSGLVQYLMKKTGKNAERRSELFQYYCERTIDGTLDQDDPGSSMDTIIKAFHTYGSAPETLWPYDNIQTRYKVKPSQASYNAAKQLTDLDDFNHTIIPQDLTAMRQVLAKGNPFLIGFTVYQSFESDQVAKTGLMPMPAQDEAIVGGHAVLAMGYSDKQKVFIVRNSWGADWGKKGYFLMPYDYITNPDLASGFFTMYHLGPSRGTNNS